MVKADAYGIGAIRAARALADLDPYAFGVATAEEGRALREAGIETRIIVFCPWVEGEAPALRAQRLDAAVLSLASLARLAATRGAPLDVHLEIDTGIGRAGLPDAEAGTWSTDVARLLSDGDLRLASAYTHFHSSDRDAEATSVQLGRLHAAIETMERAGIRVPLRHAANSDAVTRHAQYHLDLVRPGIYLYGGGAPTARAPGLPAPAPVIRVRARILEVRELAPGSSVSYGARYVTEGRERIATLAIGYADGLPWSLSGGGQAIVLGRRVPIRGAVCMDVTAVDVSGVPDARVGTAATLLGRDGDETITLEDLARTDRTIEYEILTGFGRRLPRRYVGGRTEPEDGWASEKR